MFPDANDDPSCVAELAIGIRISAAVGFELRGPPFCVCSWKGSVNGTTVPKTSVDEDGNFRADENDICTPAQSQNGSIDLIPQSCAVQRASQS